MSIPTWGFDENIAPVKGIVERAEKYGTGVKVLRVMIGGLLMGSFAGDESKRFVEYEI